MSALSRDPESFEQLNLSQVRRLLWAWVGNEVEKADLVEFADRHLPDEEVEEPEDPRRPVYVVLDALSTIFTQPMIRRDAMALLRYLVLWEQAPSSAEEWLDEYWRSVDWSARLESKAEPEFDAAIPPSSDDPLRFLDQ